MTASQAPEPPDGVTFVSVAELFARVIDGYVIHDLETLLATPADVSVGAVGYPIVMAVLAACDLLGQLDGASNGDEVAYYFRTYLAQINSLYGAIDKIAQDVLRNGLAHHYLTKIGVAVFRGRDDLHLRLDGHGTKATLYIDCVKLANDFVESYTAHAQADLSYSPDVPGRVANIYRRFQRAQEKVAQLPEDFPRVEALVSVPSVYMGVGVQSGTIIDDGVFLAPGSGAVDLVAGVVIPPGPKRRRG